MKKKIVSVMLTAAMAATLLAGCGSSSSATDTAADETTEAADETEEDAEAAEDTEAAAEDAAEVTTVEPGVLTMGTNATFPPYEYVDGEECKGIDIEIAQAIADAMGKKLEVDDIDFDSIIPAITTGKADMALAGMTVTDERKENVDFSDSYATGVQVIIVRYTGKRWIR